MPIYEYKCNSCDENFEKLVFGKEPVKCPKCDSNDIKKKFSTFGMGGAENSGSGSRNCGSCKSSSCSTC